MKKTILILCATFTAHFAYAHQRATSDLNDGLVRDERGSIVRTRTNNCVYQSDADPQTARAACDIALGRVVPQRTEVRQEKIATPVEVNAHFDTNEASLDPTDAQRISEAAKKAEENEKVVVTGYTDFRGSKNLNRDLAIRRAEAAKRVLVRNGVAENQIQVESQIPASPRSSSPCATLSGEKQAHCLSDDRKVEVQIRAR